MLACGHQQTFVWYLDFLGNFCRNSLSLSEQWCRWSMVPHGSSNLVEPSLQTPYYTTHWTFLEFAICTTSQTSASSGSISWCLSCLRNSFSSVVCYSLCNGLLLVLTTYIQENQLALWLYIRQGTFESRTHAFQIWLVACYSQRVHSDPYWIVMLSRCGCCIVLRWCIWGCPGFRCAP